MHDLKSKSQILPYLQYYLWCAPFHLVIFLKMIQICFSTCVTSRNKQCSVLFKTWHDQLISSFASCKIRVGDEILYNHHFPFQQQNFKKIRNNLEKSLPHANAKRHLEKDGKPILWTHWKDQFCHDCEHGLRTFPRLSEAHFDLTPASRMRNFLADDVLSPSMLEVMQVSRCAFMVR